MGGFRRAAFWTMGIVAMLAAVEARAQFWGQSESPPPLPTQDQAQTPPPQGTSRGENFSAKPAAQLFASDCTGAGCHRGPQGLAKDRSQGGLASFLREHYTNSRESAAALAGYLASVPGDARAAPPTAERPPRAAARTGDKPEDGAAPSATPRRAPPGVTPPAAIPSATTPPPEGVEGARPETPRQTPAAAARAQRGRQTTAPPSVPEPPPPAPPPPKEFDIFD